MTGGCLVRNRARARHCGLLAHTLMISPRLVSRPNPLALGRFVFEPERTQHHRTTPLDLPDSEDVGPDILKLPPILYLLWYLRVARVV